MLNSLLKYLFNLYEMYILLALLNCKYKGTDSAVPKNLVSAGLVYNIVLYFFFDV